MTSWNRNAARYILLFALAGELAAFEEATFVFVGTIGGAAHAGAVQGLTEANVQGRFLGQQYTIVTFPTHDYPRLLPDNTRAIVAAVDIGTLQALNLAFPSVPIFNVSLDDDTLRDLCAANLLHSLPSARMHRDALAQWRRKDIETEVTVRAWHPSFRRYAGAQLNKRFEQTHDTPMGDQAWAAWAAVKMSSDMIARGAGSSSKRLLRALRTELSFDGQKGSAMSFRENGQLRQPLLLIAGDKIVGEAPVRGIASDLDSLGASHCLD